MSRDAQDKDSLEEDLAAWRESEPHFDFRAWSSFRRSLAAEERALTDEERRDNAAWRLRLRAGPTCGPGPTFGRDYAPAAWEREEREGIGTFLALRDPRRHPDYLAGAGDRITRNAVGSIFFAEPGEPQAVLLKRGPVLLGGEERELMVFTTGFLFSRVELDTLINLLLDVNPAGGEELTSGRWKKRWTERFRDIDTGGNGSLDRQEIRDFFQGTGMPLSEGSLDAIMKRFDTDRDGAISLREFQSLFDTAHQIPPASRFALWKSLGAKFLKKREGAGVRRRLDAAYLMADVRKIENIGLCHSNEKSFAVAAGQATSTLAVHVEGGTAPRLVSCAKPGHAEAWMEALRACMTSFMARGPGARARELPRSHPGLILGPGLLRARTKKDRLSRAAWKGSAVMWADDDDSDEDDEDGV